jgi:copper oxidase (laccase) domain-containing protein
MTTRLVEIGTFPVANGEIFVVGDDVVASMLNEASRKADAARAEEERRQKAAAIDIERVRRTKLARARKRLKRALSWL